MGNKLPIEAKSNRDALYLIDSSIYVFRGWHTMPATFTDNLGNPANAVYGFIEFLYQVLSRRSPKYIACAYDESLGTSARNEIYPDYKANRAQAPDELKHQFKLCQTFSRAIGITSLASGKLEADDIIGTLAGIAQSQARNCIIISADKDLCQFVGEGDAVWDFARDNWLDARLIEKRFGVPPKQLADSLALTGDKVDNIPGIPGVGPATAARMLIKWRNIETLLQNTDKVANMKFRGAPRVSELLKEHSDTVLLARQLTGCIPDPSLSKDLNTYTINADADALEAIFDKLGFSQKRRERWQDLLARIIPGDSTPDAISLNGSPDRA